MMERDVVIAILRASSIIEAAMSNSDNHNSSGSITMHFREGKMKSITPALRISRSDLEAMIDPRTTNRIGVGG